MRNRMKILSRTVLIAVLGIAFGLFFTTETKAADSPEGPPYTITFDANGGKFPNQSTTKELETGLDGKLTSLPDNNPTNDGFVFVG